MSVLNSDPKPTISLIIPTKNEERNIGRCLESVKNNGYTNYEIILVDQNSTDRTRDIAAKYHCHIICTPATQRYTPPSFSRNLGFQAASGKYLYHLDADMELEKGLLEEIITLFGDQRIVALVIPEIDRAENLWAKAKALERSFYFNTPMEAARVVRTRIFTQIGYAPAITSGEDWNVHRQYLKYGLIARTKKVVYHYLGQLSLKKEASKKYMYGEKADNYVRRNPIFITRLGVLLIKIYVLGILNNFLLHPITVICFIILRAVDLVSLLIGWIRNQSSVDRNN